jgi:uncharacterized protein (TIGR02996 family)
MSDDRDALLAAVAADPDADAPRLVFADYLDEHGDPDRAEFIRVQCELAALRPDPRTTPERDERPRFWSLLARSDELEERHRRDWLGPVVGEFSVTFRRGFPGYVETTSAEFVARGAELFALAPTIDDVLFRSIEGEDADAVARCPAVARVRGMDVWAGEFGLGEAGAFARSPHLAGLRRLELGNTVGGLRVGLGFLLGSGTLTGLESLGLAGKGLRVQRVIELLTHPRAAGLRHIDLGRNELPDAVLRPLIDGTGPPHLARLGLADNWITDAGVSWLAGSPAMARLTDLDLSVNPIGDAGLIALAESPHPAALRRLRLVGLRLSETAVRSVLASQHLRDLEDLRLGPTVRLSLPTRRAVVERFGAKAVR